MIIVYTPADGEPEQYDASTLRVSEAAIVQRTVDMKWQEIKAGLEQDDLDAMRGIVWVVKKRSNPSLRFSEFDPGVDEMTSRMDRKEVAAYVDTAFSAVETDSNLTAEMVAGILLERLPDIAADPEHARALIEAKTQGPKETAAETGSGQPEETPAEPSSPSPTSSTPETPTSDSSPTSSTSPQPPSTN
ncbi:hypothetical protein [Streptomyces sp. NRRL S-813]|uniref:hypothetical protein n=1 Tax=Streptomyces sp. NRRL S-813 TaxID=1463919 RepID=UPI0004BE5F08|nr:hypothetical protein [Streptomyces sp. NRRL S-813]